jgi:hypothetical protein
MAHALERTSPKGQAFLGQCTKCGVKNLRLSEMHGHCVNPASITEAEALILALSVASPIHQPTGAAADVAAPERN